MKPIHLTILSSLGGVVVAIGFLLPTLGFLTVLGGALFLYGLIECISAVAFPNERGVVAFILGGLGALALIASAGAATYWFYALTTYAIVGLVVLLPWAVFIFSPFAERKSKKLFGESLLIEKTAPVDAMSVFLFLFMVGFDLIAVRWLVGASTGEAIRSPWEVIHPVFFLWIFLSTWFLILLAWRNRNHHLTVFAAMLHLLTMLSPALLIYRVGFGFDPFIHIATEKRILAEGVVPPKPFYYLGQYALVTIFAKIGRLPVELVDRLMLPFLAAVYLPFGAVYLLRRGFKIGRHASVLAMLGILIIPLSGFFSTTPQGLANLFSLMTFLFGTAWLHNHKPPLGFVILLAVAATAIHPLSGIPAALFVLILAFFKLRRCSTHGTRILKTAGYVALFAFSAIAVPLLFEINARIHGNETGIFKSALTTTPARALEALPLVAPQIETRYAPALDFAELLSQNLAYLIFAIALGGLLLLAKQRGYRRTVWTTGSLGIALLINVILLNSGTIFVNVIEYEQSNYGDRLFGLILLLLTPALLAGFAWWWKRLRKSDPSLRLFSLIILTAIITSGVYISYPRNDAFGRDRGLSVSEHDVRAVRHINTNGRMPYVVLANQSVSAAALKEFGFKKYYGDQFYYPIPTGAPLYDYYLEMVYEKPTRDTMNKAMQSVNVPRAYFVVNDYWTDSKNIIEKAKGNADAWFSIDDGKVYVFEYESDY